MSTNITDGIFRNKKMDPFIKIPCHGTPGWRPKGVESEGVILWSKDGVTEWMTVADFEAKISDAKAQRTAFYKKNPEVLLRKMRERRRGPSLLRQSCVFGSAW